MVKSIKALGLNEYTGIRCFYQYLQSFQGFVFLYYIVLIHREAP